MISASDEDDQINIIISQYWEIQFIQKYINPIMFNPDHADDALKQSIIRYLWRMTSVPTPRDFRTKIAVKPFK